MRSAWMCLCPSATKSTSTAPTKGGVARIEFSRKRSWSHTLAQARGDSHAAVSQNSTTCASVRAQVRPKSPRLTTASKKSILPSDSPVGSTPIGDLSVVRVLRVCGWLYGRRRPVHDTPGRARGRRRWKLAECDAIASKRVSHHPILQLVRLQSEIQRCACVACLWMVAWSTAPGSCYSWPGSRPKAMEARRVRCQGAPPKQLSSPLVFVWRHSVCVKTCGCLDVDA